MKVPPKRKGNTCPLENHEERENTLNESPSEKEGKFPLNHPPLTASTLNESPSEKEGKLAVIALFALALVFPSMKVPPKRKGNRCSTTKCGWIRTPPQ